MFKTLLKYGALLVALTTASYCFVVSAVSLALILNQPQVSTGASLSYYYTCPNSGWYSILFSGTFSQGSSLAVKIFYGPTGISLGYTAPTPGQSQTALQFKKPIACVTGDTIRVALTSINAIDTAPNAVKSTVSVQQGF